ncbi:MAG: signal peptidase I [Acinetobacter sp.]
MDFDFNLILVPVTFILFVVWLFDKFKFKQRERKGRGNENFLIAWAYDFWPILAVVLVLRSFFYEPFNIPSDSMVPTLETGDFILVNKFNYGVRLPLVNKKVISIGEPQRGDVIVFRYPLKPSISYIKRVVGLPGDHLVYRDGQLTVNGQKVQQISTQFAREKDQLSSLNAQYTYETLGQHKHLVRHLEGRDPLVEQYNYAVNEKQAEALPFVTTVNQTFVQSEGKSWEVKVPQGHYFAMGDNRDESADSRFWGFVPEENLTGRAFYVVMHKEPGLHLPTFSRNGKID